ncbi:cytochrome P450/oxidoreductase [Rhodococcoides corynebacterioides]|uniref:cytochrome P450/oxidoreductase n=1 Tax=Rhodococcoides corynebacterioides TaxID=53972 RepID=UPI001C9A38B4|nr:cytochrome P450/oxidoreductase [Rhodococcus corynebacterioides]MBY6349576.1 cytochrome P450 [Rhodococcus corynebacterioides]
MRVRDTIITKAQAVVPMERQIQGLHLWQRAKRLVVDDGQPHFTESPIPDVAGLDLTDIDVSDPFLWRQGAWESYFRRLRDESPVHYRADSAFGPFWSVTRYDDIVRVDKDFETFSAEPQIILGAPPEGLDIEMFIAMDPPRHDQQRAAVQGVVAPQNLEEMEGLIRSRVAEVLDELPVGEPIDWVDRVSIELTSRMLATLLDFPYDERRKLVEWTDLVAASASATGGSTDTDAAYRAAAEAARSFSALWHDKAARLAAGEKPGYDLITLMQLSEDTKDLIDRPMEFLGNIVLLVVGGNDTTRNSMTGGLLALNRFPEQFDRLRENPALVPKMVHEILRWQTPLAYMRRVATRDTVLNGQFIRKGDKVVMWYASANRDERTFENPDDFVIDRRNARHHLAFGIGTHRCMGSRLAEMQLRILWEELLARFDDIEVVGEPTRVQSNFVRGYGSMPVVLTPKGGERRQHGTWRAQNATTPGGATSDAATPGATTPATSASATSAPDAPRTRRGAERTQLDLRVTRRRTAAEGVVELTLADAGGGSLPPWTPGAHVELTVKPGLVRHYSLCGDLADRSSWTVAVLREPDGRGGSAHVHDQLAEGATLRARGPIDNFALVPAPRYLFLAGGIGITPIRAMIAAARSAGAEWNLIYVGRSRSSMAFLDEFDGDDRVTVWAKDERGGRLDLDTVLGEPRSDTLVYCCGPAALLDAVETRCAAWPGEALHLERFAAQTVAAPDGALESFDVECARTGVTVTVPEGTTIFDAVEQAGADVIGSCMEGICGTCEADVLSGTPDHRDSVLSRAERERGDTVMTCVSRSLSSKLVLDL